MAEYLTLLGYTVQCEENAAAALAYANHHAVDLGIIDVQLSTGNGFELCREVHRRRSMPVILITGGLAAQVGAKALLAKSFSLAELNQSITSLLHK
jgi:two-component system, OmpR family, response regulator